MCVIALWSMSLSFGLQWSTISLTSVTVYLLMLIQTHLYTGLFISAHDAMHGTLAQNPKLNHILGALCTFLYAAFWYPSLRKEHHFHHQYVHSEKDPDYYEGNFWKWYFQFMWHYVTWYQLVMMGVIFNILKYFFNTENIILFWIIPSLLSTLQLFYFGTWVPHHGEHQNKHQSSTLKKNHIWAFVSCYFFGYHYEHHEYPYLPWWQLYKTKAANWKNKLTKQ